MEKESNELSQQKETRNVSNKKQPDQQRQPQAEEEKILSLDEIKEMTVGQVVRKQQDIKDGVEEDDNILDRYIKQHREDIEAEKLFIEEQRRKMLCDERKNKINKIITNIKKYENHN